MRGHGLSRLLAGFLCLLLLVGIFPVSAFAASEGQQASSAYGDTVIGSDGQPYYSPSGYYTMTYHDDGSTSYVYHGGNVAYRHYVLNTDGGGFRWVYCIESGIRFGDSDDGYYSEQTDNSQYFNQLPEASRRGIMLASLYGWQPGASLPMAGINADDWYMAAQCIIWEYQQQLRSDATSRHDNGSVAENTFFRIVQGRPAEQVYYWILEQIASHSTIPSFAGATAESAPVHELKWDSNAKVYTLTLTDANNLNIDLEALTASGISVTRSGNSYTAWRDVTPLHNRLVDRILQCPMHVAATLRTKTEYVIEETSNGKKSPRKVGMAPTEKAQVAARLKEIAGTANYRAVTDARTLQAIYDEFKEADE